MEKHFWLSTTGGRAVPILNQIRGVLAEKQVSSKKATIQQSSVKRKSERDKLLYGATPDWGEACREGQSRLGGAPASENARFCVADFAPLSDERRLRSKIVPLLITAKRTLSSKI